MHKLTSTLSCPQAQANQKSPARCDGNNPSATAPTPAADRFTKLQAVLDQEIQMARSIQDDVIASMQHLPIQLRSVPGPVLLQDTPITDSNTRQTRNLRTLDSVTVQMPLAAKGRPEYTQSMNTLKSLANHLADNRGSASIVVHQAASDIQARRVNTATGVSKSTQGSSVRVEKVVDPKLSSGMETYTIKAGAIRGGL